MLLYFLAPCLRDASNLKNGLKVLSATNNMIAWFCVPASRLEGLPTFNATRWKGRGGERRASMEMRHRSLSMASMTRAATFQTCATPSACLETMMVGIVRFLMLFEKLESHRGRGEEISSLRGFPFPYYGETFPLLGNNCCGLP